MLPVTRTRFRTLMAAVTASLIAPSALQAAPIAMEMVTVGNAGNANDPATGNVYGAVAYDYQYDFWHVYSANALDHVVEQTNIQRRLEGTDPDYGCSYWSPILDGQQARLSLKFDFERPTSEVYLHAYMLTANSSGFGSLWGSKDGTNWTQLMDAPSSFPNPGAGYTYSSLLPESLLGSSEIWIQGRLQTTSGNIDAQFLRWDTQYASNQPPNNVFEIKANLVAVPEPSTCAMALAGLACGGWHVFRIRRKRTARGMGRSLVALLLVTCSLMAGPSQAAPITIDWVTVGDPGNAADTTGYGAVADSFQIMKYEFTNQQYTDFLNSVAKTDTYSLYKASMGSDGAGGVIQSGASGSYTYAAKTNMGDKPANYLSWFDAARVSNWLMNGATGTSSTETGAYTLSGSTSGIAPAKNPGATFYIPTEDQWYKAAYYKGGSTNAGYWDYATQSDTVPITVTADSTGNGSGGGTGDFANYYRRGDWNGQDGNVTTVGTNGGASYYGAFDMSGNVWEWNDLTGAAGSFRVRRGGGYDNIDTFTLSSSYRFTVAPSSFFFNDGFRLASPVPVPEPSTCAIALAGLACGGYSLFRRRRAR